MLPAKNKQKDLPQTWEKGPGQKHQLCPMGLAKLPEVLGCEGCSAWSHNLLALGEFLTSRLALGLAQGADPQSSTACVHPAALCTGLPRGVRHGGDITAGHGWGYLQHLQAWGSSCASFLSITKCCLLSPM